MTSRRLRLAVVTLGVVAAVCLGACGDESGGGFVAEANGACRARVALAERADRGKRTSNADFAEAYERELAVLRELEPPRDDAEAYRRLLDLYEERTRRQRELVELDGAIDRSGRSGPEYARLRDRRSTVVAPAANRARVRGNRLARDIGLEVCGRSLS